MKLETINDLVAELKVMKDEFTPPKDKYEEGAQDAYDIAIEYAEKVKKAMEVAK